MKKMVGFGEGGCILGWASKALFFCLIVSCCEGLLDLCIEKESVYVCGLVPWCTEYDVWCVVGKRIGRTRATRPFGCRFFRG